MGLQINYQNCNLFKLFAVLTEINIHSFIHFHCINIVFVGSMVNISAHNIVGG